MDQSAPNPYVLNIEDNDGDAYLLQKAFKTAACEVPIRRCVDGKDAVQMLESIRDGAIERPKLVLLDLKLPFISGIEVLEFLRADPKLKDLEVVIFTCSDERRDYEAAERSGFTDFYTKPVDYTVFRVKVKEICDRFLRKDASPAGLPQNRNFLLL